MACPSFLLIHGARLLLTLFRSTTPHGGRLRDLTPRKVSPSQHSVGSEPASCLAAAEACD